MQDLGPGFDPARLAAAAARPLGMLDAGVEDLAVDVPTLEAPRPFTAEPAELAEGGRGLFLVSHLAPALAPHARAAGGMTVSATLPVKRPTAASYDPPRRTVGSLPALAEAQPTGGFGKESFLRALVVQLARAVEFEHGQDAADRAVAQVGVDVGGQMEQEFRAAEGVVGQMTPEQLARCYVRLKHAIDGGFYVIEVTDDRIVLGNRRCPFSVPDAVVKVLSRTSVPSR